MPVRGSQRIVYRIDNSYYRLILDKDCKFYILLYRVRKILQNLRTLQGYIFRIIQHFATKLCNFTHFSMLFQAVVIYLHILA